MPGDRGSHRERLGRRFGEMMSAGLLDEVAALHRRGDLTGEHPAMRAVGYRQLWGHLDGVYDLETAVARAIAATRQLAKRQLTWLRAEPGLRQVDPFAPGALDALGLEVQKAVRELGR